MCGIIARLTANFDKDKQNSLSTNSETQDRAHKWRNAYVIYFNTVTYVFVACEKEA